jgi:hypothetical protein
VPEETAEGRDGGQRSRDVATDHAFQTNRALRPARKVSVEPAFNAALDHRHLWEPEYEHHRHPTNLRSPAAISSSRTRSIGKNSRKKGSSSGRGMLYGAGLNRHW